MRNKRKEMSEEEKAIKREKDATSKKKKRSEISAAISQEFPDSTKLFKKKMKLIDQRLAATYKKLKGSPFVAPTQEENEVEMHEINEKIRIQREKNTAFQKKKRSEMSAETLQRLREIEKLRKIEMRAPMNAIKAEKDLNQSRFSELGKLYMTTYKKVVVPYVPPYSNKNKFKSAQIIRELYRSGKLPRYIELLKLIVNCPHTHQQAAVLTYLPYTFVVTECLAQFGEKYCIDNNCVV